jgi:lipopolysaccharide export LptBFGC system permease protein LptF|nr:LptF/LptG family permease [Pelagibacteraceae bacterium]
MKKIDKYIFLEILKGCLLILFIFLSISWLLQFARLISLTNLIQVDIITIFYLSMFLIPNLISIIIPFVIIFGLIITFIKLHKDKEIISIYSLGLSTNSLSRSLKYFTILIILILLSFNFYISPKIYKEYKLKEFEIRNKIDFEKIVISNFLQINKNTFLDFKKDNQEFKEVFIKFSENNDNLIYAKNATIIQDNDFFIFNLIDGFKITIINDNKIEKLEFENYNLKIKNNKFKTFDNFDKNTFNIFDDIKSKNYLNITHKGADVIFVLIIILFFYFKNIKVYRFDFYYLFIFITFSSILLILNQLLKNLEISFLTNVLIILSILICSIIYFILGKENV